MVPIHFQANYLPDKRKFRVEFTAKGRRNVELMTVAKYLRWARNPDAPIKIGGWTVTFDGDSAEAIAYIRAYFKKVADAYVELTYRNN